MKNLIHIASKHSVIELKNHHGVTTCPFCDSSECKMTVTSDSYTSSKCELTGDTNDFVSRMAATPKKPS